MGARQKLNSAYFIGAFALAVLVGLATQSWVVFLVTLAVLVASQVYTGQIRPDRRRRK
jgi:1,4-dihydroxy-2-naphthoate octaprenyltransferase